MKELKRLIDKTKTYTPAEAVKLAKETAKLNFEPAVELHIRLGIDAKKGDQQVRSTLVFPHGSGKKRTIAAFVNSDKEAEAKKAGADIVGGEELIKEITTSKKTDFDVAIATPDMMKVLAPAARVLGPRGLMPSPKNGTVTPNVGSAIEEFKKGKIDFKNDSGGNVHIIIGKTSMTEEQLLENFELAFNEIKKSKPSSAKGTYIQNVALTTTMGPSITVAAS